jgi:hypothetical protein
VTAGQVVIQEKEIVQFVGLGEKSRRTASKAKIEVATMKGKMYRGRGP